MGKVRDLFLGESEKSANTTPREVRLILTHRGQGCASDHYTLHPSGALSCDNPGQNL